MTDTPKTKFPVKIEAGIGFSDTGDGWWEAVGVFIPKDKDYDAEPVEYTLTSSSEEQLTAAVLAEREACARLVEELWAFRTCREVADAIRSKSK